MCWLFSLQISIEGVRGPSFEGDIAVDSISFIPGRCMTKVSDEEIQADSHLGLGENSRLCSIRIKHFQTTRFVKVSFCSTGKEICDFVPVFLNRVTSVQSKLTKNKLK